MKPVQLESTTLSWALYDARRRRLELEFRSGKRYVYFQVPVDCYRELLKAESKGEFFNREIREHFPSQDLSDPGAPLVLAAKPK